MIGKVLRGGSVGALVRYLYGPGRANEHLDPRIVAGWRPPERLEPAVSAAGGRDFRRLVALLREPVAAAGLQAKDRPVYHLVVASGKADAGRGIAADRALLDEQAAARLVRAPETGQMLALLAQLAALADAVARMRGEQDRSVQADAARQAAEQIRAEHIRRLAGAPAGPGRVTRPGPGVVVGRRPGSTLPPQRPGRSR